MSSELGDNGDLSEVNDDIRDKELYTVTLELVHSALRGRLIPSRILLELDCEEAWEGPPSHTLCTRTISLPR